MYEQLYCNYLLMNVVIPLIASLYYYVGNKYFKYLRLQYCSNFRTIGN